MVDRIFGALFVYIGLAGLFIVAGFCQAILTPHDVLPAPQDTIAVVGLVMGALLAPIIFVGALVVGALLLVEAAK